MGHPDHPELIGSFRLTWELGRGRLGERWVAIDERSGESKTVHRIEMPTDSGHRRRLLGAIERSGMLACPHLLTPERFSLDRAGHDAWIVTPYRGHNEGLVTIEELADARGGRLDVIEGERTMDQLLEGVRAAHAKGVVHGPIDPGEVLVDRHGSVWVELYGLTAWGEETGSAGGMSGMVVRDEVRSIVALGYRILTGLPAEDPRVPAGRIVKKLDKAWDRWFDRGLDATEGFASADEALASMPGKPGAIDGRAPIATRPVRRVLARFQRANSPERPGG